MSFWGVVFVVLMCLWLFFGAYVGWVTTPSGAAPDFRPVVTNTLIPWLCVAILGWLVLGGPYR